MSTRFKHSDDMWRFYQEEMDEDSSRFEPWYDQHEQVKRHKVHTIDREDQPGDMLFVPVDPKKPVEWITGNLSNYDEIRDKARSLFEKNGSCVRALTCCDSSDEDEPQMSGRQGVVDIFQAKQLFYSFVKAESKLACLTCHPRIMKPEKKVRLNERAAQILGKLYGVSILQRNYMSKNRLRGDAILCMVNKDQQLQPRCIWAPDLEETFDKFLEQVDLEGQDEEVIPHVRLQGMKLWSQAWLDYGTKFSKTVADLEEMAQPEDWMNRLEDGEDAESTLPYLESYMQFKFAFSLHQSQHLKGDRGIRFAKGGRILIFATGLLQRRDLQPICGVYDCGTAREGEEPPPYEKRYKFREWTTDPDEIVGQVEPLDLLTDECMGNGATRSQLQLHELKTFDPYAVLEMPERCLSHIADKVDRFDADNRHQQFKAPSGWDLQSEERRKEQVKKQLDKVRAWCRTDRSIPIMTVFGDFTYQWLVPLPNPSQEDGKLSENPTLVAVLQPLRKDPKDAPCYILKTVLTLDMALMQARLCGKLHQRWTVSQRQAVELQKVVDAVKEIPGDIPEVKRQKQKALAALRTYKECIMRFLPSVATVEDCQASRRKTRPRRGREGSSCASAPASDDESRWSELAARRAAHPREDPWKNGGDPWSAARLGGTEPN